MMRYTPSTRRLWKRMLAYHHEQNVTLQQPALNALLARNTTRLRAVGLDERRFLSGYCFYEARPLGFHNIMHDEVVGVHHNWIRGDGSKYSRAAAYRVLATEAASRREFVEGARAAMTS